MGMNYLETMTLKASNMVTRCQNHVEVEEDKIDLEAESLYLLRQAAIDAEERRYRQIAKTGRELLRLGCE